MQRISTATRWLNKFGLGKSGFRDGDLANGIAPTDLVAAWFDHVQEEIARVIEATGAALDGEQFNQLYVAIQALIQAGNYDRPGRVNIFLQQSPPIGWLPLHGLLLPRADYPALWAHALAEGAVSEAEWVAGRYGWFSAGDGATTFRIPDVRAMFIRALDGGRGIDAGRQIGSYQGAQLLAHGHGVNDPEHAHAVSDAGHNHGVNDPGHAHGVNDAGHSHGVNDPGHAHNSQYGDETPNGVDFNNNPSGSEIATWGSSRFWGTTTSATGISIQGSTTNVSISSSATGISTQGSPANVSVFSSATGISIQSTGGAELRVANIAWPMYIKY